MSKTASVVEINGTRYDAGTGAVIGSVKRLARQVKDQSNARVIDGFVRRPASAALAMAPRLQARTKKPSAKAMHQAADRSHTLMRGALDKPAAKPHVQALSTPLKSPAIPEAATDPDQNSPRAIRARTIVKNANVRRFGELASATRNRGQGGGGDTGSAIVSQGSAALAPTMPGFGASLSHQKLERMLDRALIQADAHKNMLAARSKNPLRWIARHKLVSTAMFLVVLALATFFVWQSMPAISMDVAARRAGLSSTLPAYVPDNFKVTAPIDYSAGAVNIHYASTTGKNQTYIFSERKSNWDSASLAANAIPKNIQVRTSEISGTTVYVYGASSNATWVNNGIWYTITNHAGLSSDQLLRIAENM